MALDLVCVGAIHHVDGHHPKEAYRTVGPVLSLMFSPERQYLVVVTQGMDLCQVAVSPKGEATEMMKVGSGGVPQLTRSACSGCTVG